MPAGRGLNPRSASLASPHRSYACCGFRPSQVASGPSWRVSGPTTPFDDTGACSRPIVPETPTQLPHAPVSQTAIPQVNALAAASSSSIPLPSSVGQDLSSVCSTHPRSVTPCVKQLYMPADFQLLTAQAREIRHRQVLHLSSFHLLLSKKTGPPRFSPWGACLHLYRRFDTLVIRPFFGFPGPTWRGDLSHPSVVLCPFVYVRIHH